MDRINRLLCCLFAASFATVIPNAASAIGGDVSYGFSEIQRGMGGAAVALPQDAVIPSVNPAGISFLDKRIDGGVEFMFPVDVGYDASPALAPISVAPGEHTIGNSVFYLPDVGFNVPIDAHDTFNASLYSFAGFGVSYAPTDDALVLPGGVPAFSPGVYGDGRFTVDQKTVIGNLSLAHKFGDTTSVGAGLLVAGQMFEVRGANQFSAFSTAGPGANLNRGSDYTYGIGATLGFLTSPNKFFSFGASYQPPIRMAPHKLYSGLIVDGGRLDIPPIGTLGVALHPWETLVVEFDVQEIWYKSTANWSNGLGGLVDGSCAAGNTSSCFGGANGPAFGWGNQLNYKLGLQWNANDKWILRAGWNHANQLTPANAVVTGIIQIGGIITDIITVGATHIINKHNRVNAAMGYVPHREFSGPNALSMNNSQNINLRASGVTFAVGWSYLFK